MTGGYVLRIVGQKDGGEILVHYAGPVERTRRVPPPLIFFDVQTFGLVVVLVLDAAGGIRRRTLLIAETGGPHGEGGNRAALEHDRGFDMDYISVIETERLADGDVLVGVLKRDFGRSMSGCPSSEAT